MAIVLSLYQVDKTMIYDVTWLRHKFNNVQSVAAMKPSPHCIPFFKCLLFYHQRHRPLIRSAAAIVCGATVTDEMTGPAPKVLSTLW